MPYLAVLQKMQLPFCAVIIKFPFSDVGDKRVRDFLQQHIDNNANMYRNLFYDWVQQQGR